MDDPIWISQELALAIHKRQLAEHGGLDGVRDLGLLQSAIARPRHLFAYNDPTPELPALAASYAFGIARNHPFIDGNKRTAAVVCETFLELNGLQIEATDLEMYPVFLDLAAGTVSEEQLTAWLVAHVRRTDVE
ncbi:MAG TPA: type II toxin-antitoxin system death-on-curing family toxin [Tepidisphaeraceae bacterium]|jgi:death-on-curing protein|nr:type II toxin-antitoxin system death-on-curing family toxin [Tepidisphaeraceae bacterium]